MNWFKKLLGQPVVGEKQAGPAVPSALANPAPRRREAPSAEAAQAASQAASQAAVVAARSDGAALAGRVPVIQADGRLAGFHFPLPPLLLRRLAEAAHASGASTEAASPALLAHIKPLAAQMQVVADEGRVALLLWSEAAPLDAATRLPARTWLVLPAAMFVGDAQAKDLAALKAAGLWCGSAQVPQRGAAFVHIDGSGLAAEAVGATVAACKRAAPGARIVMGALVDLLAVEAALEAGAELATGALDRLAGPVPAIALPPAAQQVSRLMGQLLQEAELASIATELRADVALSYALLQHANSPLLGLSRAAESAEQAVMLLGRDAMYRWLCAKLVGALPARRTARALQEMALARALLFESLAPALAAPAAPLYSLGLMSLLDVMVPMPMSQLLQSLPLPAPVQQALGERSGPWAPLLAMAGCLERGDVQGAAATAQSCGGIEAVQAAHAQAWAQARQWGSSLWSA